MMFHLLKTNQNSTGYVWKVAGIKKMLTDSYTYLDVFTIVAILLS